MICVECSTPIRTLYDRYKGNHIRLTICESCNKVADRYIEFDKVLLFIDLMLLKPQAYRHTIYNQSLTISDQPSYTPTSNSSKVYQFPNSKFNNSTNNNNTSQTKLSIFTKYSSFLRLLTLMLLFEVYLTWAYEEKNYIEDATKTSLTTKLILDNPTIILQYGFFLTKAILDSFILNISMQFMIYYFLDFGNPATIQFQYSTAISSSTPSPPQMTNPKLFPPKLDRSTSASPVVSNHIVTEDIYYSREYFMSIISTTILISNLIKLFPIVMLIWPYDTFILNVTKTVVQLIHLVILVEAVHIVLLNSENNQYWKITLIVLSSQLLKFLTSHLLIISVFLIYSNLDFKSVVVDEINQVKLKLQLIYELLNYVGV